MTTTRVILIAVPDVVLNAVDEALCRQMEVMRKKMALHRDDADRVMWALESYRVSRFRRVQAQIQTGLAGMEGLSPETKTEMREYIEKHQDAMPRSKRNAAEWTARKAELKRAREALQARRHSKRKA